MATNNQSDSYMLRRDDNELLRLNAQHDVVMRHVCGDKFVVDDSLKIGEHDFVLDSGAGTCAWALGLSTQVNSSVQIYATDVSPRNFPPPESSPPNIHLSVANSLRLPIEWSDKFDFVHQRLLIFALRADEWPIALSEIFRVLKPGGAVQLVEGRPPLPKGPASLEVYRLLAEVFRHTGHSYDILLRPEQLLADAGFTDIHVRRKGVPVGKKFGDVGEQDSKTMRAGLASFTSAFEKAGLIQSQSEYSELLDQVEREWDEYGSEFDSCLVTARKPVL